MLAVSLQYGDGSTSELATIPASEELRDGDEAIVRGNRNGNGEASSILVAQIERMAAHFHDRSQSDLANAWLAELFAFCFAKSHQRISCWLSRLLGTPKEA